VRVPTFLFIVLLAVAGCGTGHVAARPHGTPPPELEQAMDDFDATLEDLVNATPVPHGSDFKVPDTDLTGFDLWDHVVSPMLDDYDPDNPLQRVNRSQYAAFVLFLVDYEIGNGGMHQLYYNATGEWADEFGDLLRYVGAPEHARILERANRIVGPAIPRDTTARRLLLKRIKPERFAALEDAFYALEDLEDLVPRFIRAHPRDFFQ
jgi:hypothetical protein